MTEGREDPWLTDAKGRQERKSLHLGTGVYATLNVGGTSLRSIAKLFRRGFICCTVANILLFSVWPVQYNLLTPSPLRSEGLGLSNEQCGRCHGECGNVGLLHSAWIGGYKTSINSELSVEWNNLGHILTMDPASPSLWECRRCRLPVHIVKWTLLLLVTTLTCVNAGNEVSKTQFVNNLEIIMC